MPGELYENPRSEISQGDILEVLPHLYLEKPLQALSKEAETIYRATPEPFTEFNDKDGQSVIGTCKRGKAILISHDCEVSKPHVKKWIACPVVPLFKLHPKTQDLVRRNRVYSMLFLPRHGNLLGDSFVDFNQMTTLDSELVKSAKRLTSLSDVGRRTFYAQFIRWLTRWELRELECPHCAVRFDPQLTLHVRST